MRVTAYLLLLFFTPLLSIAQLSKGQWMLGGVANLNYTTHDYTAHNSSNSVEHIEETAYNVFAGAGYFFIDRCVAGLRATLSNSITKDKNEGISFSNLTETTAPGAGIGAFARYYLFNPKNHFNGFAEVAYSYNSVKETLVSHYYSFPPNGFPSPGAYSKDSKYNVNYYSFAAGPVIFISSKVSFELSVGYSLGNVTNQDRNIKRFAIGSGFQVFLGK